MQERSTQEIIEILGNDIDRCHSELVTVIDAGEKNSDGTITADYGYTARQLIRATFAYIEAVTFSVKAWSANHCMENNIEITPEERYFSIDTAFEINSKGEIYESKAKIPLASNIRFAIELKKKAKSDPIPFDASIEWWSCLKKSIKVRDRLTHPKMPEDVDVSGEDITNVLRARAGFESEISSIEKQE